MVNPTATKNISAIKEVRRLFNMVRNSLSDNEKKRIRRKLYKKDADSHFFKNRENNNTLTDRQKNVVRSIARYIKNISTHLKNLGKHLNRQQKNQYGLDYLFDNSSDKSTDAFKNARDLLNEHKSNLSNRDIDDIRRKLYRKEVVYYALKRRDKLSYEENNILKRIDEYLNNFKSNLEKLQGKYQYNTTYGLDSLFNDEDDYYRPKEVKRTFDGGYIVYESKGDISARRSINEYFDIIKPYLRDLIDDHKSKAEWKIKLAMRVIFISMINVNQTQMMYSQSDNVTIMIGIETDDIIDELIDTFTTRYQEGLETRMKESSFTFDHIDLLEYDFHRVTLHRGSSYIKSAEWLKNKGVTINPKNTRDNNCFQYAIVAALNHQNIDNHPERISEIRPFVNNYDWKGIEFPEHSKDWRKFESNNKTIALNVLYVPYNKRQEYANENENTYDSAKYMRPAYISKHNKKRDIRANLSMIENDKGN